ncbi:MAG: multicopper oxidase domain-containing protein [Nitrospirota bacterium]|nr:multicopper oxidase domain-containing protein [Nitrospirota bacterium]
MMGSLCSVFSSNRVQAVLAGAVTAAALSLGASSPALAIMPVNLGSDMQCPHDIDNAPFGWAGGGRMDAGDIDWNGDGTYNNKDGAPANPNQVCLRVGATDGYYKMPDGTNHYMFGFTDLTGIPENKLVDHKFEAKLPAPTVDVTEGQELFLTITNLALLVRPDLPDPHTIHFHGFPHAMSAFDGVPHSSVTAPAGASFTYYYKLNDPGTYAYHCHVEPTEHIAMGMVGTLVVHPRINVPGDPGFNPASPLHAYDDQLAGSPNTAYNKEYVIHVHDVDPTMPHNLETVQEMNTRWAQFSPTYFTINGRAYPDTLLGNNNTTMRNGASVYKADYIAQNVSSLITIPQGQRVLLRLNNLTYQDHSLTIPGIPMRVVGEDAQILRSRYGKDLSFTRTAYSLAGGQQAEVILDTTGLAKGTYFLYARELYAQASLTREERDLGTGEFNRNGMITEIRIQ